MSVSMSGAPAGGIKSLQYGQVLMQSGGVLTVNHDPVDVSKSRLVFRPLFQNGSRMSAREAEAYVENFTIVSSRSETSFVMQNWQHEAVYVTDAGVKTFVAEPRWTWELIEYA